MLIVILVLVVLLLLVGPSLWVKFTLKRYAKDRPDLAGTGGELAQHLLTAYQMKGVSVETTQEGKDHFDVKANCVRLSPSVMNGRSLTAVAVATHEVGHAIQYGRKEKVTRLRRYGLPLANSVQKLGSVLLLGWPVLSLILHIPYLLPLHVAVVSMTSLAGVFIRIAILPEEWDASFGKALPILREGQYVGEQDLPKISNILTACAFTYVASALLQTLFFWRYFVRR